MDGARYQLLSLFADGGLMMYPLVLCSLLALGVIMAKAFTLWVAHKDVNQVLESVGTAAEAGRLDEALEAARSTPGPTAAILHAGLRRIRDHQVRRGEIEQAITTTGTIELGFLERGLVILATVANVAPLMGFLGTVVGMILAFDAIEQAGNVDPALVAGGIKVALLTTAAGLVIAIPVNIAYNFFVARIDQLIIDMEQGAQRVLNIVWDMEKQGTLRVVEEQIKKGRRGAAAARPAAPAAAAPQVQAAAATATISAPSTEGIDGVGHAVQTIEGIGPGYGKKLAALGIETTKDLLARCSSASGRGEVQEHVGVEALAVRRWSSMADLLRIDGLGGQAAEILEASGVASVQNFAGMDAAALAAKVAAVNEEQRLVVNEELPSPDEIGSWMRDAVKLHAVLTDL